MGQAKLRGNKKQRILTANKEWTFMKKETKAFAQLKREIKIDELQSKRKELYRFLQKIKK